MGLLQNPLKLLRLEGVRRELQPLQLLQADFFPDAVHELRPRGPRTGPYPPIGCFLLGIEELASQIEEPFSILPIERYCDEIERTMREVEQMEVDDALTS